MNLTAATHDAPVTTFVPCLTQRLRLTMLTALTIRSKRLETGWDY